MSKRYLLIQGAMDIELKELLVNMVSSEHYNIFGYEFYVGKIYGIPVILSKTNIGTINATMATMIALNNFKITAVINQGIAGSHLENIHVGDIIIGKECVNINSYDMPVKGEKLGSNPFEWKINERGEEHFKSDKKLYDVACDIKYSQGKIYSGIIGSGDVFNREYDRIKWIRKKFKTLCEEMESIGTYSVCNRLNVPCIGIRIISNNELNNEEYNREIALNLQSFIERFICKYNSVNY